MKKDIKVKIFELNSLWRYEIKHGKSAYIGSGDSLEDAEKRAFKMISEKENIGTVHIVYESGKSIKYSSEISFKEALIAEGFIKE